MIRRLLILLLAVVGIGWLLGRALRDGSQRRRAVKPGRATGRMVRDRVCETFLPADLALSLARGGRTHYFCSASCRDRFLAGEK